MEIDSKYLKYSNNYLIYKQGRKTFSPDVLSYKIGITCITVTYCLPSALIKSFNMVRYRPVYENLIDEIGGMWPDGAVGEEEHKIISSALKQINFVVKGILHSSLGVQFLNDIVRKV